MRHKLRDITKGSGLNVSSPEKHLEERRFKYTIKRETWMGKSYNSGDIKTRGHDIRTLSRRPNSLV
jgi:hypothetical protein